MRLAAGKLLIPAGKSLVGSLVQTFGTLRNYDGDGDGDGNGNVKNAIGLKSKTTILHVHHAFLYISLLSLHNQDGSWPNFKFTWERKRQGDKFYHLCQNSGAVPSLQLQPGGGREFDSWGQTNTQGGPREKTVVSNSPRGANGFCYQASEFCSQLARQASEVLMGDSSYRRTVVNPAYQKKFGLVKIFLGLVHVHASCSLPKWQAVNWPSLHPEES